MEKSSFGHRLRLVFGNAKYAQIAEKIGVSEATVKVYMAGRVPDADKLANIARLTNCNLHWLLTGEGPRFVSVDEEAIHLKSKIVDRLRTIAHEQADRFFADADIVSTDVRDAITLTGLAEFLLYKSLERFNLIEPGDLLTPLELKSAERFTFVANIPQSMDERIREMIRREMSGKNVSSVAQTEEIRAMIRDIVKEEVSNSRKRPVFPLRVADAADDEIEETTRRKAG